MKLTFLNGFISCYCKTFKTTLKSLKKYIRDVPNFSMDGGRNGGSSYSVCNLLRIFLKLSMICEKEKTAAFIT